MPLFEVAILEMPTTTQVEGEGKLERLAFGPTAIIAKDEESAGAAVILEHKDNIEVDRNRMKVLVRPFA